MKTYLELLELTLESIKSEDEEFICNAFVKHMVHINFVNPQDRNNLLQNNFPEFVEWIIEVGSRFGSHSRHDFEFGDP